ncbi:MAG TPA: hypothetical protein VLS48_07370 [Anaerolineales bacterium]|nr:hypothetical protein [Anaerolineales bacterium]
MNQQTSDEDRQYRAEPVTEDELEPYDPTPYDQGFSSFDQEYRAHFAQRLADQGRSYEYYLPGYGYGYRLATDERFRHKAWDEVAPEAQTSWKSQEAPWEDAVDAIRFAFEKVQAYINQ